MSPAPRRHSPAAERNRAPILAELQRRWPGTGLALELASGSGQHAAFFAAGLPGWRWQPTEADPVALGSIADWCAGVANVLPALPLDVLAPAWPGAPADVDAVFCANLLHISPWAATAGLMRGAARHLAPEGRLWLYGPFFVAGEAAAPGNLNFDADLRGRDPTWGVRRLDDVAREAAATGLRLAERIAMPANNLLLVFERAGLLPGAHAAALSG